MWGWHGELYRACSTLYMSWQWAAQLWQLQPCLNKRRGCKRIHTGPRTATEMVVQHRLYTRASALQARLARLALSWAATQKKTLHQPGQLAVWLTHGHTRALSWAATRKKHFHQPGQLAVFVRACTCALPGGQLGPLHGHGPGVTPPFATHAVPPRPPAFSARLGLRTACLLLRANTLGHGRRGPPVRAATRRPR